MENINPASIVKMSTYERAVSVGAILAELASFDELEVDVNVYPDGVRLMRNSGMNPKSTPA
eukprot:7982690-Prorocentrum_lima.AAC.1